MCGEANFAEHAAAAAGIRILWKGAGVDETGVDERTGRLLFRVNPAFFRPAEVELLVGHPVKAREKLGSSASMDLATLAATMFEADARRVREDRVLW